MEDQTLIDCLYEELFMLDEQAGCFDEVTNRFIDEQRRKLMIQILELEVSAAWIYLKRNYPVHAAAKLANSQGGG